MEKRLFQPQEPFNKINIGLVNLTFNTIATLAFFRFFGQ